MNKTLSVLLRGAAAGVAASVIQAMVGKAEEKTLLPPWEDSNIAPRFIDRLANTVGIDPSYATEWTLGTAFHLGYAVFWGGAYAAVRERHPVHPVLGGALLGGLIHGITFPRWGGAVQTGTERPPEQRSDGMHVVVASVTLTYGLATALLYEPMARRARG